MNAIILNSPQVTLAQQQRFLNKVLVFELKVFGYVQVME